MGRGRDGNHAADDAEPDAGAVLGRARHDVCERQERGACGIHLFALSLGEYFHIIIILSILYTLAEIPFGCSQLNSGHEVYAADWVSDFSTANDDT